MTAPSPLNYNLESLSRPQAMLQSLKRRKGNVKEESHCCYLLQPFYSLLAQDGGISHQRRCREGAEVLCLTLDCSIRQDGRDACFRHSKCSLYRLQHTQKPDCAVHVDSFYILQKTLTALTVRYLIADSEWTKDILAWLSQP